MKVSIHFHGYVRQVSALSRPLNWDKAKIRLRLEVHGRARRKAARRRKSECKVNLFSRNSSRSNDSWRIAKSTKYSAAAIGAIDRCSGRRRDQWGSAVNTRRPINTLLVKTTHDSTPASTWLEWLWKETRDLWTCVRLQCTTHYGGGQYVDQSSSRSLEKFGEDILTSPEVIRVQTLHFKPNFKFSRLKIFWGTPVPVVVCASKAWSICNA